MRTIRTLAILLALAAALLGLNGCEKKGEKVQIQQALPLIGSPVSPLPTPNTQTSPIQR